MKLFERAHHKPKTKRELQALRDDINRDRDEKDKLTLQQVADIIKEDEIHQILYVNDKYQVSMERVLGINDLPMYHLSIKRLDKETIHDWRDLQEIKNQLVGEENEGMEIYPSESRLVDGANQYHLWVFANPEVKIPIGFFDGRQVSYSQGTVVKQRPKK